MVLGLKRGSGAGSACAFECHLQGIGWAQILLCAFPCYSWLTAYLDWLSMLQNRAVDRQQMQHHEEPVQASLLMRIGADHQGLFVSTLQCPWLASAGTAPPCGAC